MLEETRSGGSRRSKCLKGWEDVDFGGGSDEGGGGCDGCRRDGLRDGCGRDRDRGTGRHEGATQTTSGM